MWTKTAHTRPGGQRGWGMSIRTGSPYMARHLTWYDDYNNPTEETLYYNEHVHSSISIWKEEAASKKWENA